MPLPDITLAQFNKIASGKYNAGQVDFKTDKSGNVLNELVKINNHVHSWNKNNVTLPADRVLAIKETFVNALKNAKVSDESLREIRNKLGLSCGELDTLSGAQKVLDRRYTPLTRDQIRTIIDKYAERGKGFEDGTGVATDKEIRAADRTRNMSYDNKLDRNVVNVLNRDLVATGQDQTVKDILRLMKGDSLERLNRVRTAQITGDGALCWSK